MHALRPMYVVACSAVGAIAAAGTVAVIVGCRFHTAGAIAVADAAAVAVVGTAAASLLSLSLTPPLRSLPLPLSLALARPVSLLSGSLQRQPYIYIYIYMFLQPFGATEATAAIGAVEANPECFPHGRSTSWACPRYRIGIGLFELGRTAVGQEPPKWRSQDLPSEGGLPRASLHQTSGDLRRDGCRSTSSRWPSSPTC